MSQPQEQSNKKRTSSDCRQESIQLQLHSGGLQYQIEMQTRELKLVNDRLRDLSIEANGLKAQEDAEAKIRDSVKAELQAAAQAPKPQKKTRNRNPKVDEQATTQPGSEETESTPEGPDGQSQKKE